MRARALEFERLLFLFLVKNIDKNSSRVYKLVYTATDVPSEFNDQGG